MARRMTTLPRKLQFKDRFVYHLTRQIEGDCEGEPILFPDDDTPIKFVVEMSQNEFTSILSALMTGADLSYPENSHEVVWRLLRQVECPVSICEEILECLQPAFDEINDKLDVIDDKVDEISDQVGANISKPPNPVAESVDSRLCGAAVAVVEYMNARVLQVYAESESGFFDNVTESTAAILSALPIIGQLPLDELILMANAYFSNQQTEYESDYLLGYNNFVFALYCRLLESNGAFDYVMWGAWLDEIGVNYAGNRAASVFSRYSPASATFINQIAAFIFGENSFEEFFREIYLYFLTGAEQPSFICAGADCGKWRHTIVPADEGVTFAFSVFGAFDGDDMVQTTDTSGAFDVTGIIAVVTLPSDRDITNVVIDFAVYDNVAIGILTNAYWKLTDASNNTLASGDLNRVPGAFTIDFDDLVTGVRHIEFNTTWSGSTQVIRVPEFTIAGNGLNPF
jgi:hypothetical protein